MKPKLRLVPTRGYLNLALVIGFAAQVLCVSTGVLTARMTPEIWARRERVGNRPYTQEEDIQDTDGVRQLKFAVVVRVGGIHAIDMPDTEEQDIQDPDSVG